MLYVWKRSPALAGTTIPLRGYVDEDLEARVVYPTSLELWRVMWLPRAGCFDIDFEPAGESARVIRLHR